MVNFKQRYKEFISARDRARESYSDYNALALEFKCLKYIRETYDRDFIAECAGEGYCFDEVTVERLCTMYNHDSYCLNKSCEHQRWNCAYIDAQKKWQSAKKERNRAFWNLFKVRQK